MKYTSAIMPIKRKGKMLIFFTVSDFYRTNLVACQKGAAAAVGFIGHGERFIPFVCPAPKSRGLPSSTVGEG